MSLLVLNNDTVVCEDCADELDQEQLENLIVQRLADEEECCICGGTE